MHSKTTLVLFQTIRKITAKVGTKPFIRESFYFIFLFLILYFAYSPVIHGHYLFHDDFYTFTWNHNEFTKHPQFAFFFKTGRAVYAFLNTTMFYFINEIQDANKFYFLAFLLIVCCAYLIFRSASKSLPIYLAFTFSILATTLPPFQVLSSWLTAAPQLVPVVLSGLSASMVLLTDGKQNSRNMIYRYIPQALLLLAFCTHQQAPMFYWVIAVIELIAIYQNKGWEHFIQTLWIFVKTFSIPFMIYIPFMYFSSHVVSIQIPADFNPSNINSDVLDRLQWFAISPVYRSLNLWVYPTSPIVAGIVILLFSVGLWRFITSNVVKVQPRKIGIVIILGVTGIVFTYLPVLISRHTNDCYRYSIAMTPLFLVFFFWSLRKLQATIFNIASVGLAIFACFFCRSTLLQHVVLPHENELRYVSEKLKSTAPSTAYNIYFTQVERIENLGNEEYDSLTSFYDSDLYPLIVAGIHEAKPSADTTFTLSNKRKKCDNGDQLKGIKKTDLDIDFRKVILSNNPYHFRCRV